MSTEEFISKSKEIHDNIYDYSLANYKNMKSKIKIICLIHGIFNQTAVHHLLGCGCPICNSSKGENEIRKYLKKYNIIFKEQKKFENCKNKKELPFDFYLLDYNICIEYDGKQHFEPVQYFGGDKNFIIIQKHDKIKTNFCANNNITLIRIPYTENNIENIIKTINN
jgi:very-short-patch-repair endonuclease